MTTILNGKPTFGAGRVFATANLTNPTPARALVPQGQSIEIKRKTESLFGEKQFAEEVGAGEMEITGKVEFGKIQPRFFADILFGDGSTTGSYLEADGEAGTVPASTAYVVTVTNAATFKYNLGVRNADTGAIYTRVAPGSEVTLKSYSVDTATGIYTFAAGDANANMKISYAYADATNGETIVLTNQLQGPTGRFQAVHVLPWGAKQDMFVLNNCIASSSGISAKKSGFSGFTLDYMAASDSSGAIGTATFAEAA
ncbi:hypothetical protein BH10PSE14_BH10PSE14_06760 [soil metagenome]